MQTKQKWALTLTMALGAISCGGSTEPGDPYMGFIDATVLDAKFQPGTGCGSDGKTKCYLPAKAYSGGEEFSFHNLGLIAASDKLLPKDAESRPILPASAVKATAYDFPEGCKTGKEYDQRTDAYREDLQSPVFDALPLTNSNALVLPLVKTQAWTGVSKYTCNAIKDAQSLRDGDFGGAAAEGETFALRGVIDMTHLPARPSEQAVYGWYRGLQLAYLDGGAVPVDADGNLKVMDGVWLKPSSSSAKPTDATAKLVFQAKPGEDAWSPVVRLREVSVTGTYTRLCYDPPCAADAIDMTAKPTYTGVLFLVASPQ
ncbi:hypothetical protein F0U61_03110 [Archangium violaceum]|uniref:hypothetical protein n=1 Tax=Archangium violaceum TaxID=83451 RepID=UPI002B284EC1|nr:hypothetical protein F0U61_03110 [Archangium violaceum]